jgi:hypothetical protein
MQSVAGWQRLIWLDPTMHRSSQAQQYPQATATTFYYMGVQYTTATGINTSNHLHLNGRYSTIWREKYVCTTGEEEEKN